MPGPVVHDGFRADLERAAETGETLEIRVPGERIRGLVLAVSDDHVLMADDLDPFFIPLGHINSIWADAA